jgi:hypothetical protein
MNGIIGGQTLTTSSSSAIACGTSIASGGMDAPATARQILLRLAVMMAQRSLSYSPASCDMLAGFSFGSTVRGFTGAFAAFTGALFFSGMVAARVLRAVNWMGAVW